MAFLPMASLPMAPPGSVKRPSHEGFNPQGRMPARPAQFANLRSGRHSTSVLPGWLGCLSRMFDALHGSCAAASAAIGLSPAGNTGEAASMRVQRATPSSNWNDSFSSMGLVLNGLAMPKVIGPMAVSQVMPKPTE